jgi:hypothetical protein
MSVCEVNSQWRDPGYFGPWFSGFTDGEGSFSLGVAKSPYARFTIGVRADDQKVLIAAREHFGCGLIQFSPAKGRNAPKVSFRVQAIGDLWRKIVPHFDQFPLLAKKAADYAIWRSGAELIYRVVSREKVSHGYRCGFQSRWSAAELERFKHLCGTLVDVRSYQPCFDPV